MKLGSVYQSKQEIGNRIHIDVKHQNENSGENKISLCWDV